jgi:hypothetical protein
MKSRLSALPLLLLIPVLLIALALAGAHREEWR